MDIRQNQGLEGWILVFKSRGILHIQVTFLLLLLPSGSEQHEVLVVGSIQEGILQAHQNILQTAKNTLKIDIVG